MSHTPSIVRRLTVRSQGTTSPYTRAHPGPPSRYSWRPSLFLPAHLLPPLHLLRPFRSVVGVFSSHIQDRFTHWVPPALPLSTDLYVEPTTPSLLYTRSHMPDPDDPPFGSPAVEESFSLPAAHSPQVHNPFCEQRKLDTSHSSDWTPVLTIRDLARHQHQFPGFDPFDLDISTPAGITVSDFVVVVSLIHSRDCAGYNPARNSRSRSRCIFVWPSTDQEIRAGGAKIRPSKACKEAHVTEEWLEPNSS